MQNPKNSQPQQNYTPMSTPNNRIISYGQAIREATAQEMQLDNGVFVYGLGVDDAKGHYGSTLDLHKEFGDSRCFDMPLSEDAMTGIGIGAALAGMRPIFVHQRMDFLMLCMNQLVNMAAKIHYISDGKQSVPFVVRASIGRSWGQGAQHSQSLYNFFTHIPGIKVIAPNTPHDAKAMMAAAILDNNPVVMVEHRMVYAQTGIVPNERIIGKFGVARTMRDGQDITLVGMTYTILDCIRAADLLAQEGIQAEVIDPITLSPMDYDAIAKSLQKTGKLLIVENDWLPSGVASEIIAQMVERGLGHYKMARIGYAPTPCPTSRCLELEFYPSPVSVAIKAHEMINGKSAYNPPAPKLGEIEAFKGPF